MYKIPYPSNPISLNLQNLPLFIVHVVALLVIKYDLCTLVQIGGLFQSYKLRGISRYVSRYGPPYRGIPRYGNSSRYPPLVSYKNRCYSLISNEVYLFSQTLSYILILPKLFYLQTSVKSQRSYIGR